MVVGASKVGDITDTHRDAAKYRRLLLALERATGEIRDIGEESYASIEEVLGRLLPDLAQSLNAEQAFVAVLQADENSNEQWLELTVVYPQQHLSGCRLPWSKLFERLLKDGKPKTVDPLDEQSQKIIPGLELFKATAAILVQTQFIDQVYVVGICNKADPALGAFLAVDGRTLDNIVELVAIGARVGQQRQRELQAIQSTSAVISAELDPDVLLPMIARKAAEVFNAPAASLMLWDDSGDNLVIKARWGLSDEYAHKQTISKKEVQDVIGASGVTRPLLTPDLQRRPFGDLDLIKRERLRTVLTAPLLLREQLTGILNIYSKDEVRQFTAYEQELAHVLAGHAAIAVQNAGLYKDAQSHAMQLQGVLSAGQNITALRPIRDVLQAITDSLVVNFGYDAVTLFPYQTEFKTFAQPVISGHLNYPEVVLSKATGDALVENRLSGPELHFTSHSARDALLTGRFIERENVQASGYVRLTFGNEVMGILFVNYRQPHVFSDDEQRAVQLFANQAAIAIRNAEQFDKLQKSQQQLEALHRAGEVITKAGIEERAVLQTILDQAVAVTGANFGTIQMLHQHGLEFAAAWPQEYSEWLKREFGNFPLDGPGITVRAVKLNDAQLVPDVTQDPAFVDATGKTGAELAVVLRHGGHQDGYPIGVLNVEHQDTGSLDKEDRDLLIRLADLAAVALQNAEHAEQLSRTNAVALMGAWGADIAHDVNREVGAIRLAIFSLQQRDDLGAEVKERLAEIEEYAAGLALPELPEEFPDFGDELEVRNAPDVDRVIRSEVTKMRQLHPGTTLKLALNCPDIKVAMHEQWLRRLLRHFIKNAVGAAAEANKKPTVTVHTNRRDAGPKTGQPALAEISIEDNGKGVRPEIELLLFKRPIPHSGSRAHERKGRGLLLVSYVVELHGGQVWLDWSQPGKGARFSFSIPLAQ